MSSRFGSLLNHNYTPLPIPLQPDPLSPDRTLSLSSTSSVGSFPPFDHSLIFIPNNCSFSSIPFSWEKLPGIPKRQLSKKIQDPTLNLLPLPPSTGTRTPSGKYTPKKSFEKDPFFKAFVECSKDDDESKSGYFWKRSAKITRSLSNRFAFVKMCACKRSCPVPSIIYVRKPQKHYILN